MRVVAVKRLLLGESEVLICAGVDQRVPGELYRWFVGQSKRKHLSR